MFNLRAPSRCAGRPAELSALPPRVPALTGLGENGLVFGSTAKAQAALEMGT